MDDSPRQNPFYYFAKSPTHFMKTCSKCKIEKSLDSFFKKNGTKSGLQSACKQCKKDWEQTYYYENGNNEKCRIHRENTKEYQKVIQKKWRENNKDIKNFHSATYKALKINATPKWLSDSQKEEIKAFYIEAKKLQLETGINYHVDHIHPLQGKNFCGLHVPWNLQILTETENLTKNNKLIDN